LRAGARRARRGLRSSLRADARRVASTRSSLPAGARRAGSRRALELAGWCAARGVEARARACGLERGARGRARDRDCQLARGARRSPLS
jgi:hypothetical protein